MHQLWWTICQLCKGLMVQKTHQYILDEAVLTFRAESLWTSALSSSIKLSEATRVLSRSSRSESRSGGKPVMRFFETLIVESLVHWLSPSGRNSRLLQLTLRLFSSLNWLIPSGKAIRLLTERSRTLRHLRLPMTFGMEASLFLHRMRLWRLVSCWMSSWISVKLGHWLTSR